MKYAIKGCRRVKEQLKKIDGMVFNDVQLSYIRHANKEEIYVPVPQQSRGCHC